MTPLVRGRGLVALLCALTALAACAPSTSISPAASIARLPSAAATAAPRSSAVPPSAAASATALPPATVPRQSETEWGRIWTALPPDFPVVPEATPGDAPDDASGGFNVPLPPSEVVVAMQAALELAQLSTESLAGPLDDGSYSIVSVGEPSSGCRVETTIAPAGTGTALTVLYGAECPFPLSSEET